MWRHVSYHSTKRAPVEIIGMYKEYDDRNDYRLSVRMTLAVARKTIAEKEKIFDFADLHDILIGSKIEINGQEYAVIDKKYQLNGDIDYYIEDSYIKCEDFDEQYEALKEKAKEKLKEKWDIENELRKPFEEEVKRKKSIWWYFGIR